MSNMIVFLPLKVSKKNFKMKKVILRQKKVGVIPLGPYDVYVNNVYVNIIR